MVRVVRLLVLVVLLVAGVAVAGCGSSDLGFGCPGADPPPPDVSGTWSYDSPTITSSTCTNMINQRLLNIFDGPCEVQVEQNGTAITTTDCLGRVARGCVDSFGVISVSEPLQDTTDGCTLTSQLTLVADLSDTTTTGAFRLPITFSGNCGVLTDCQAIVSTDWTLSD